MTKTKQTKAVEEKVLKIAIEIARQGDGALFVIGDKVEYERLFNQKFKLFSVFDKGAEKLLKGLGVIDGAVIIGKDGIVKDYGVMIKKAKAFTGFGTRHSAAFTASKNSIVILCSEEEKKVKIFKNGKYVMQIDALQKNVEKSISKVTGLLEGVGAGLLGTIGAVTLVPALGITLIPGVLIFGGSYLAIKKIIEAIKGKK